MKRFWIAIMSNYWNWWEGALCILKWLRHSWNEKVSGQHKECPQWIATPKNCIERMKCDMEQCYGCCNADECALNKICVRNVHIPIGAVVGMCIFWFRWFKFQNASIDFGGMASTADHQESKRILQEKKRRHGIFSNDFYISSMRNRCGIFLFV